MKEFSFPLSKVGLSSLVIFRTTREECKHLFPNLESSQKRPLVHSVEWPELFSDWLREFFLQRFGAVSDANAPHENALRLALLVESESGMIKVTNSFSLQPNLECVCCLSEFRPVLSGTEVAYFCPGSSETSAKEHELNERELSTYPLQGSKIVFDEFLLDTLEGAIPLNPKCSEVCRGLCIDCGTNLNLATGCEGVTKEDCSHFPQLHLH